ncbi:MAG: RidA family protein [Phycisphaerales bacterium]|jgi:enamine deaminase RidA (YjgF/YER057c/UK114 family)|nr:RidA family protein [Phycisphaerales bacterium]
MSRVETALEALGIALPEPPAPVAAYVPVRIAGSMAFVSGQVPMQGGVLQATGPVPSQVSPDAAADAARLCVINALAALKAALDGDLDRVEGIVRVGVFVASDAGFAGQPQVADGASQLLVEVLGTAGKHARAALGCIALPLGASVEVELIAALRDASN